MRRKCSNQESPEPKGLRTACDARGLLVFNGTYIMKNKDLVKIIIKTNGRCFYCNKMGDQIDHFISKKKWSDWNLESTILYGELNNVKNLFLACKNCNISKKDMCPEDFIGNSYIAWNRYQRANKRIGIII